MFAILVVIVAMFAGGASRQQHPRSPHFDVVSIKPQPPGTRWRTPPWDSPGPVRPGGSYIDRQAMVPSLMRFAYPSTRVKGTVLGLPRWATSVTSVYDFQAKSSPGTNPSRDQLRLMMRAVLAERFHLRFHMVTRTVPVYLLEIDKGGPKGLSRADPGHEASMLQGSLGWSHVTLVAHAISLQEMAAWIGQPLDRPVLDRTGLPGYFDVDIEPKSDPRTPPGAPTDRFSELRDFFQEELGLRLVASYAALQFMVVDEITPPTTN